LETIGIRRYTSRESIDSSSLPLCLILCSLLPMVVLENPCGGASLKP
jgi:hypothetical protein